MEASNIRQYLGNKRKQKLILKVNVRYVNCIELEGNVSNNSTRKERNLVNIKIHGTEFKDVPELRSFLEPLLRVKKLSVDWPPAEKKNYVPSAECSPSRVVEKHINRLTYLAVTLWDVPYLKKFVRSLEPCHLLKELYIVVVTDHTGSYEDASDFVPNELKSLEIVEVSGFRSMEFKRHFATTLPDPEKWTEFQLAKYFNIQGFHLEKKNLEICDELLEKKFIENMSYVYGWDDLKMGGVLLTERLLRDVIGITHENAPPEFCCLQVLKDREGCALKVEEMKLLLKNPRYPISLLYMNHNIEAECDVHLVGAAFPNLTELVLSNIIKSKASIRKETEILNHEETGTAPEGRDESANLHSSFKMFIEKTPHVRDLTMDAHTNKLEDEQTWDLAALYLIPDWKNLRTLRLLSIPIGDGKFLIEIGKQCTNLETIMLHNLGPSHTCCYINELSEMLTHCRNLKDFTMEANNIGQVSVVFTSLAKSPRLKRVRVMSRGEIFDTIDLVSSIKQLLRRCAKLTTLVCIIDRMTRADSNELASTLQRLRDELNRPSFQFQVVWPKY